MSWLLEKILDAVILVIVVVVFTVFIRVAAYVKGGDKEDLDDWG